jgi:hypothetical protein
LSWESYSVFGVNKRSSKKGHEAKNVFHYISPLLYLLAGMFPNENLSQIRCHNYWLMYFNSVRDAPLMGKASKKKKLINIRGLNR